MLSKFHQQGVMHGSIDYFCLVCEDIMRTATTVSKHIQKPIHVKNLDKTSYVNAGNSDRIRKVRKGYYCESCNILVATITKINSHIKEEKHLFNKSDDTAASAIKESAFLKRVKTSVVAFDDIVIADLAWEGIIGNSCVVCNEEFHDANIHKSKVEHTLNVIQAKIQIGADNISRKVDDSTYQCLTCNTIVVADEIIAHFDQPEHSRLYLERRRAKRAHVNKTDSTADKPQPTPTKSQDAPTKAESVKDNGNHRQQNIAGPSSSETSPIQPNKLDEKRAIEVGKNVDEKKTKKAFAEDNYITIENDRSAFCSLCKVKIPSYLKAMEKHVEGNVHQDKEFTKPTVEYIRVFMIFAVQGRHGVILNKEICLEYRSFLFITRVAGCLRCVACQVNVFDVESHRETYKHQRIMENTPVLYHLRSEFVRRVREEIYHCGFCNQLEDGRDNLRNHLQSSSHKEQKEVSARFLQRVTVVEMFQSLREQSLMMRLGLLSRLVWSSDDSD